MIRRAVVAGAAVLFAALVTAPVASAADVSMINYEYSPATVEIDVGESVTWTNFDAEAHTATDDGGRYDSGDVPTGGRYTQVFNEPGTFPYHCTLHPGQTGTVIVRGASATTAPPSETTAPPSDTTAPPPDTTSPPATGSPPGSTQPPAPDSPPATGAPPGSTQPPGAPGPDSAVSTVPGQQSPSPAPDPGLTAPPPPTLAEVPPATASQEAGAATTMPAGAGFIAESGPVRADEGVPMAIAVLGVVAAGLAGAAHVARLLLDPRRPGSGA